MVFSLAPRRELIVDRTQLSCLVVLAEHQDLTRAAAALGVDESVVEASIGGLEQTLGVPLLEGSTGLTAIGDVVCRLAQVLLARPASGEQIDLLALGRPDAPPTVGETPDPLERPPRVGDMHQELVDRGTREYLRIGRELHDVVGQELTGLAYLARGLADSLEAVSREGAIAAKLEAGLDRALSQVRALARGLVPVAVDPDGLRSAVADLVERMSGPGTTRCSFECSGPVRLDDSITATHLYRIAQEAVTNARRHARATEIRVRLKARLGTIRLEVRDDGCGFPPDATPGTGLRTMQERAHQIGARLHIAKGSHGGTVVACTLPVER